MAIAAPSPTPVSEFNKTALKKVFSLFSNDLHLTTLIGAVIYAGKFSLRETGSGTHFYMDCPNSRTAQELSRRSIFLFTKLHSIFPITRLYISTVAEPFEGIVPFDESQSLGCYPVPPNLNIGVAEFPKHPDWFLVAALDDESIPLIKFC